MGQFGEQRRLRGTAERTFYRVFGVPDPAHYLHAEYFKRASASPTVLPGDRCLDAGCGSGDYSFYMARRAKEVVGIDLDAALVEKNERTAAALSITNARFQVADLATFESDEPFDFAVCIDVLEHIPDNRAALRNIFRALRPGGTAFLHFPVKRPKPVPLHRYLDGFHAWIEDEHIADELTADEFVGIVHDAGFMVLERKDTFGYWTGELATSLFALPYSNTPLNRIAQVALSPICKGLAALDQRVPGQTRFAVALTVTRSNWS